MKTRAVVSLALVSLLGCTDRIQEGGFETSDLQALVQRPDGSPVAAARVWLVRSRGDSAAAVVIDSTLTDTAGKARFLYEKGADLSRIGLDAQAGDSLGLAPSVFAKGTVASVALQETKSVQIGRDSNGALLALHVPGSHFASKVSENGTASVLALPKGTWDVAFVAGTRVQVVRGLAVRADTVIAGVAGVKAVATDTLQDGPDIALDSFRVDGIAQFLDTSLEPAWNWQSRNDTSGLAWIDSPRLVSEDTGWTSLATKPLRYQAHIVDTSTPDSIRTMVQDTFVTQGGVWIQSPRLPDTGTVAIQMEFTKLPSTDSGLFRTLRLTDSTGSGLVLLLPGAIYNPDSIGVRASSATLEAGNLSATQFQDSKIWYISWSSQAVTVRSPDGIAGSVRPLPNFQGPIKLEFSLFSPIQGLSCQMHFQIVRLYTPK